MVGEEFVDNVYDDLLVFEDHDAEDTEEYDNFKLEGAVEPGLGLTGPPTADNE